MHGNNISLSTLKTTRPRNGKITRSLASDKIPRMSCFMQQKVISLVVLTMLDIFWFQTALCRVERLLGQTLSRKILKRLNARKVHASRT